MNDFDTYQFIAGPACDSRFGNVEIEHIIEYNYSRGVAPIPMAMIGGSFL